NDSVVSYHNFLENLDPEYKKKGQVITFVPEPGTGKKKLTKDELYNIYADAVGEINSLAAKNKEFENKLKNTIDELVKHRNDASSYKSSLESVQEGYKKLQKKNEEADAAYKRLENKFDAHKEDTGKVLKRIKGELEYGNALGRRKKGINYAKQITGELIERLKK
ncbi:hypothetical protein H0N96_00205, partial [Candidatus Micrarchaeota archaeon]|nr:hypothetical protein [Candidatus Micrarchaeota archaeon]